MQHSSETGILDAAFIVHEILAQTLTHLGRSGRIFSRSSG
jgi:hypothetical protein